MEGVGTSALARPPAPSAVQLAVRLAWTGRTVASAQCWLLAAQQPADAQIPAPCRPCPDQRMPDRLVPAGTGHENCNSRCNAADRRPWLLPAHLPTSTLLGHWSCYLLGRRGRNEGDGKSH